MCPVHTPDGSPCGLLNHLASACEVVVDPPVDAAGTAFEIHSLLVGAGMLALHGGPSLLMPTPAYLPVLLDGAVLGFVVADRAQVLVKLLRAHKARARALQVLCTSSWRQGRVCGLRWPPRRRCPSIWRLLFCRRAQEELSQASSCSQARHAWCVR